jgi:hypothetical protein
MQSEHKSENDKEAKKCNKFIYFDFPWPCSLILIIPYNINFVQRGFAERAALDGRFSRDGRGFTVLNVMILNPPSDGVLWTHRPIYNFD